MTCSNNIYLGFCTYGTCQSFTLPDVTAPATGTYKLSWIWMGNDYTVSADLEEGDPIAFPLSAFNEQCEVVAAIIKPDGTVLSFAIDTVEYDAFILRINLKYSL